MNQFTQHIKHVNNISILVITILLVCVANLNITLAQQNTIKFKRLTRNDGLASNKVNCISEDHTGFIWFGTQDGLCKFNGYDFEIFRHDPFNEFSICDNRITCVIRDTITDNLWIGTEKGLCYYNSSLQKFNLISTEVKVNSELNKHIYSLFIDLNNKLWIGTALGLNHMVSDTSYAIYRSKNNIRSIEGTAVYAILQDTNSNIWVGSGLGLYMLRAGSNAIQFYANNPELVEIRSIYCGSDNNLWIGTDENGVFLLDQSNFNSKTKQFTVKSGHLINNRGFGIVDGGNNNLYIIDRDGGLVNLNMQNNAAQFFLPDIYNPVSLSSKALISVYKSSNGIIWMGTYNGGVCYIDKKQKAFEHYQLNFKQDGLFCNNIRCIYQGAHGDIWIGTKENGGLSKFNRDKGTFIHYRPEINNKNSISDEYIFALNELNERYLLVGTFKQGMDILDKQTGKFRHFKADERNPKSIGSDHVYAIYKDWNGEIWVGNYGLTRSMGALNKFNPDTETFDAINAIYNARCFLNEDSANIWIGTYTEGLYLYNKLSGSYQVYKHYERDSLSLSNNEITALQKDSKNNLWIGTDGGGINFLAAGSTEFKSYTKRNGLPNNRIFGLLIDDNDILWVSTAYGLSKFDTEKQTFRNYDVLDGVQGNEFEKYVALRTQNGEMIFGGSNGFNIFHPNEINDNDAIPKVIITGFKLANKEVEIGVKGSPLKQHISKTKAITLNHKQSIITFQFVALNYTVPEKNQYAYKLEGFDEDWIYSGNKREATYTNMHAGEYVFRVKASNNDNYWNNEGVMLKIRVLPPWYKTWWFIVLLSITLIGSVLGIYYWRVNMLKAQKRILEQKVAERTCDLEKTNIELEHHKNKLEEIVEERTKELVVAKNRAEESDKLKSAFLANMSHEIRTPMNAIIGFSNLLESDNIEEEDPKEYRRIINSNSESLLVLLNDILDTSLIEANQVVINKSIFDLNELFVEFENYFKISCEKEIDIFYECNGAANTVLINSDRNRIKQIVTNLISNAIKYTHKGYVKFGFSVKLNELHIYVSDTGIGISDVYLDKIFDQFFKIEDDNSKLYRGSGIGLYICKKLVSLMSGQIKVESAVNKGTNILVKLPYELNESGSLN